VRRCCTCGRERRSARDTLFAELDALVGGRAAVLRLGSIAANSEQVRLYSALAESLGANKTVCEVGFNAGHSAAVWLLASPTSELHTFDIFSARTSLSCLKHLQRRFPGRLTAHRGDSLSTVPHARLPRPCDLIHIDGRHSFLNVVADAVNMLAHHATPHTQLVFDDQCNAAACNATSTVAGEPTLATCELERAGFLQSAPLHAATRQEAGLVPEAAPLATRSALSTSLVRVGRRFCTLFRVGERGLRMAARLPAQSTASASGKKLPPLPPGTLPCVPRCRVSWATVALERRWGSYMSATDFEADRWQRALRPSDCVWSRGG